MQAVSEIEQQETRNNVSEIAYAVCGIEVVKMPDTVLQIHHGFPSSEHKTVLPDEKLIAEELKKTRKLLERKHD